MPYCQPSCRCLDDIRPGDSISSLLSASLSVSPVRASFSVLPNFSSSFFSFSAQAASLSSRALLSSSSRRLRALSTAEMSAETNFPRGGACCCGSSCSSADSLLAPFFSWCCKSQTKEIGDLLDEPGLMLNLACIQSKEKSYKHKNGITTPKTIGFTLNDRHNTV